MRWWVGNAASWQIIGVLTGLVVALSSLFAMATVGTEVVSA